MRGQLTKSYDHSLVITEEHLNYLVAFVEDGFVDTFLKKEGETVEEAKSRLAAEDAERRKIGEEKTLNSKN